MKKEMIKTIEDLTKENQKLRETKNNLALSVMRAMNDKMDFFDRKLQLCKWIMGLKLNGINEVNGLQTWEHSDIVLQLFHKAQDLGFKFEEEEEEEEDE